MSIGISERLNDPNEQQRASDDNLLANLRVAIPGIVQSFDPASQTVSVQPAIMENVRTGDAEETQATALPLLTDVPVQFPRGGGYCVTLPVKSGDECLLVFSDMCMDGWWQSGGVQNQMERRRHDLSDAVALLGITSVPRAVQGYSVDALQVRSEDGETFLEVKEAEITLKAQKVWIEGEELTMKVPKILLDGEDITMKTSKATVDGDLKVTGTAEL